MSPFSAEQTPAEIQAYLEREARRRRDAENAPAVDALARGLAFADGPGPDDDEEQETPTLADDPALDDVLESISRVQRDLNTLN